MVWSELKIQVTKKDKPQLKWKIPCNLLVQGLICCLYVHHLNKHPWLVIPCEFETKQENSIFVHCNCKGKSSFSGEIRDLMAYQKCTWRALFIKQGATWISLMMPTYTSEIFQTAKLVLNCCFQAKNTCSILTPLSLWPIEPLGQQCMWA